jgi:hypothetical protein
MTVKKGGRKEYDIFTYDGHIGKISKLSQDMPFC